MAELVFRVCLELVVSIIKALGGGLAGLIAARAAKPKPPTKSVGRRKPRYHRRRGRKEKSWQKTLH
jgi:hypothetical protein